LSSAKSLRRRISIALGLFLLYASLSSFRALWPFMVELAEVDSASYGSFVGVGSILSVITRGAMIAANSVGVVIFTGALFSIFSAAVLMTGYTYYTILFSTIFQRMSFAASMMGRGLVAGMEVPKNWRGVFTAGILSSAQLGILLGVNLGLALFMLTGSYFYALVAGVLLAILSMTLLAPWIRVKLFQEQFSLRLLIPKRRAARLLMLICCVDAFVWGGIFAFAYVLAPSYLGASEIDIALARTMTMILAIPLNLIFGALSDKIKSRKLFMILSELVGAAALTCYAFIRSPISIMIFGLLMGLVASTWGPIVIAFFTEVTAREELGATLSSWSLLTGISRVFYPVIGGFLIAGLGVAFYFSFSAFLLLTIAALIWVLLREPK